MLAFRPVTCNLDALDTLPELKSTNGGFYAELLKAQDSATDEETRLYYTHFLVSRPHTSPTIYSRGLLFCKAKMLHMEWQRRHRFFQDLDAVGRDELQCSEGCLVAKGGGKHAKTEEETEWERLAATAYTDFVVHLNRLHELEQLGHIITGYTFKEKPDFGVFDIPLSLFELPVIPGPHDPPPGRVDVMIPIKDQKSCLNPDGELMAGLLKNIITKDDPRYTKYIAAPRKQSSFTSEMITSLQQTGRGIFEWWKGEVLPGCLLDSDTPSDTPAVLPAVRSAQEAGQRMKGD